MPLLGSPQHKHKGTFGACAARWTAALLSLACGADAGKPTPPTRCAPPAELHHRCTAAHAAPRGADWGRCTVLHCDTMCGSRHACHCTACTACPWEALLDGTKELAGPGKILPVPQTPRHPRQAGTAFASFRGLAVCTSFLHTAWCSQTGTNAPSRRHTASILRTAIRHGPASVQKEPTPPAVISGGYSSARRAKHSSPLPTPPRLQKKCGTTITQCGSSPLHWALAEPLSQPAEESPPWQELADAS